MPISDKVKKLLNKFSSATIKAAMNESPAVMQAAGWDYDKNGNLVQGDPNAEGPTKLREGLAAASLASSAGTSLASIPSGAAFSAGNGLAKAIEWTGEKAMPSSFFNGLGHYLPEASGYLSQVGKVGDAAALSYWSAKAADAARKSFASGDDVSGSALAATAALPVAVPLGIRGYNLIKNYKNPFKFSTDEIASFSDDIARLEAAKKYIGNYSDSVLPEYPFDDPAGLGEINFVEDLAETARNRDWLKDFNRTFVRRYHYDPVDLKLSSNTEAAEDAVKKILSRHNRVVRGSSDFMSPHANLKQYEKDFFADAMREAGLNPHNREDRLLYSSVYYSPKTGYGRAGVNSGTLASIAPDGTLTNPAEFLGLSPQGTHYASNSIGTAQGYTYGDGKVALLEYPYSLGPDRTLWKYEADAPVSRVGSSGDVRRFFAKQYQSYLGEKPAVLVPEMQYEHYDVPVSKMTVGDLERHEARTLQNYDYLNKIRQYLSGDLDVSFGTIYEPFVLPRTQLMPSNRTRDLGSNFLKEKLGYIDNPKTVGDAITNTTIYNVLSKTNPRLWYGKDAVKTLGSIVKAEKDAVYKRLKGPINSSSFRWKLGHNINQYYNDLFKQYSGTEGFEKFVERLPKERIKDATARNLKKEDSAFTHLISVGEVGTPAANFVEWIDPHTFSPEQVGIITRQHYGTGADFLTRNTRSEGGSIHIKPENRGKFTALKERTGHSASWFKEKGTPAQKKMAVFALNARKWNHADGGPLVADYTQGYLYPAPDSIIVRKPQIDTPVVPVEEPVAPAIDLEELKKRQYFIESKFNDKAVNKHSGAMGAYQIMPITLKDYTQRTGETGDLYDYAFNEKVRDFYMNRYLNSSWATKNNQSEYNRAAKALAAYNWGSGNLIKYLEAQKKAGVDIYNGTDWLKGLPGETRNYIKWTLDGEDIGMRTTNAGYEKAKKKRFDFGGYVGDLVEQSGGDREKILEAIKNIKASRK